VLLEVLLARGNELDGSKLVAVYRISLTAYSSMAIGVGVLPAVLEAGDDGANQSALTRSLAFGTQRKMP
jgi:hypothetical protein